MKSAAPRLASSEVASILGLGEGAHSHIQRWFAVAICFVLTVVAVLAIRYGSIQGPELKPFLPIAATTWALADLMTAFLLFAQFYLNGTTGFLVLGAAYAVSGLLTWPYLLEFPGLFHNSVMNVHDTQMSVWLWAIWHTTFPVMIAASSIYDPQLRRRIVSRIGMRDAVTFALLAVPLFVGVVLAIVYTQRGSLPLLIVNGHFNATFRNVVAPAIVVLNVLGCLSLLHRGKKMTTLHLWVFVALFTATLDAILNTLSPTRYSFNWYVGKVETVLTASVVLGILLCEVTGLYRRLSVMAIMDPLTQLFNRRGLEEHTRLVLSRAKRQSAGIGMLVIDVDFFKGYNDAYGHAGGDDCLRKIAAVLKAMATRPMDHVSRFGGEEFVVVVPDTPLEGVIAVAERIIEGVELANIPYDSYALGHVTVSVGVSFVASARDADGDALFQVADGALYMAKKNGRNTYVTKTYVPSSAQGPQSHDGPSRELAATLVP